MEDAPKWLKIPKSECPDIWIRLPRHKWLKSWSTIEDPVVPLERNLYGHPLAGPYGKGNSRKSNWNMAGKRQCEISRNIVDNYRTMFESRISAGESGEITILSNSSYFFMVLWHGWSCEEVCGTIFWVSQQDDSTTLHSIYSMHRWPPL